VCVGGVCVVCVCGGEAWLCSPSDTDVAITERPACFKQRMRLYGRCARPTAAGCAIAGLCSALRSGGGCSAGVQVGEGTAGSALVSRSVPVASHWLEKLPGF